MYISGCDVGRPGLRSPIKIAELREATDWEKPVYVKIGSARPRYDVQLAVKAGADVVVRDGMQGGTGATQEVFIEHAGIPTLPALRQAVEALEELGMHRKVQLVISGGIRSGADVAKALAMGADAVSIGTAALVALGCNRAIHLEGYAALGTEPGACHHCHTGRCSRWSAGACWSEATSITSGAALTTRSTSITIFFRRRSFAPNWRMLDLPYRGCFRRAC